MAKNENKAKKTKKHFFKDFKAELKKVIWPTPKQLINSTIAVVTIVLVSAVIVLALDIVFEVMNKNGISNLQNIVNEKFNAEEENEATETEQENQEEEAVEENTEGNEEVNAETETTTENGTIETTENTATPAEGEQTNVEQ